MGVKNLWTVLEPVSQSVGISDLEGKTLAVDLSGWLFQSERATQLRGKQDIKPHLRHLFSRVCLLLRHRVRPVFVLDGPSPQLKQETLHKRRENNKQYSKQDTGNIPSTESYRGGLSKKLTECCELLACLGVPYLTSPGEAEAFCALLQQKQLVDGCITEDNDVFLFGARLVYRNFNIDTAKTEEIKLYEMADIEKTLQLCREKLVAMAMLIGCDYDNDGVMGVGKEKAMKMISSWNNDEACQRIRGWRGDEMFEKLEAHQNKPKPPHCRKCRHPGTGSTHKASGCQECGTDSDCNHGNPDYCCNCEWHENKDLYKSRKLEFSIRKQAMLIDNFPNEEIIQAFLDPSKEMTDMVSDLHLTWKRPDFNQTLLFLRENHSCLPKVLPLLTIWDMTSAAKPSPDPRSEGHSAKPSSDPSGEGQSSKPSPDHSSEGQSSKPSPDHSSEGQSSKPSPDPTGEGQSSKALSDPSGEAQSSNSPEQKSIPLRILKAKVFQKRKVLEVEWKSIDGVTTRRPASSKPSSSDTYLVTQEFREVVESAFPQLVLDFDEAQSKAKTPKSATKRRSTARETPMKQPSIKSMFKVRKLVYSNDDDNE